MFYNGLFFSCVSGSIYLPHMFCLFPILGYRFSYLSLSLRHPLGPHFALEMTFHYSKPCFFSEESVCLSLSFFKKNYFIFPFFSFCLPSQLWCVFILCVFNYKLPPTVLFLWSLHHFLLFSTTYFLFPQLTGLLNCPSIDDIFGSRVLFLSSFFTLFNSTQFGNALTWNGRTSWFFHCFYSLLFESPSLNLLTRFLD